MASWGHTLEREESGSRCSWPYCPYRAHYAASYRYWHSTGDPYGPARWPPARTYHLYYCRKHAEQYAKKHGLKLPAEGGEQSG